MIQNAIEKADRVLVVAHVDPDGDAIGSLTAVGQALQQMGKQFTLACDDSVPYRFRDLPLGDRVIKSTGRSEPFDLVIAVDCGDASRMGHVFGDLPDPKPTLLNIDHHITNTQFGDINLVEPKASSTAEILYRFLVDLGVTITPQIAESLLTGMVTDTLGFRTDNVTADTLRVAGDLVAAGADIAEISVNALHVRPLSTAQLWQIGLKNMQLEDGLLWTSIRVADRKRLALRGLPSSSGLVNFLADVDEVKMGVVLTEMPDGSVRVSMRCRPPYDVAEVATSLGGGGHVLAAGCALDGPLADAEALLVSACTQAIYRQTPQSQALPE